jgi:CheY-like chemotaxis protein
MPQAPLGKSVLVVEDDNAVREITALLLKGQGYTVTSARDGCEALALLRCQPPPDLILLDLWMPWRGGLSPEAGVSRPPVRRGRPLRGWAAHGRPMTAHAPGWRLR